MFDKPALINRQKALREQIDAAIRLLLEDNAYVSANLLAWAAIDVLRDICKVEGKLTLANKIDEIIKPEHMNEWYSHQKEHYNFSKHANIDPYKVMLFNPKTVYFAVFRACIDYEQLFNKQSLPMILFKSWNYVTIPGLFVEGSNFVAEARKVFGNKPTKRDLLKHYRTFKDNEDLIRSHFGNNFGEKIELD
jgi:hypothetical protein